MGQRIERGFRELAATFSDQLLSAHGRGYLAGLKFRQVEVAQGFQRRLLEAGLWTRVHAYHEGHSTVLTKLGLLADEQVVDFVIGRFRKLLSAASAASAASAKAPRRTRKALKKATT